MFPLNKEDWQKRYLDKLPGLKGCNRFWSLPKLAEDFEFALDEQPFAIRLFLENILRKYENNTSTPAAIRGLTSKKKTSNLEFSFYPTRVLMQDYTGVPAIADLAALRDAVAEAGADPRLVNPVCPVDLVIDHSVIADQAGTAGALSYNREQEMARNQERYQFLKWAQQSFDNLTIVPPGRGICHQVNLEFFAQVIRGSDDTLSPDTLVGTDSHTTMINGLGVLGWGVGGIEAEAVMMGQPLKLNMPKILGVKLNGQLPPGTTATDLVLTITEKLRHYGVVGKYVEFYGPGVLDLDIADRATVANMAPEYGATCGLFPIDEKVVEYLALTNRPKHVVKQVRLYSIAQGLWYETGTPDPHYPENLSIQLSEIEPSVSGPKRPQDRVFIPHIKDRTLESTEMDEDSRAVSRHNRDEEPQVENGDIVIAAITSCTNTSNPHVMILAGLLAKAAIERGLSIKPYVKTSLAPGSQVVAKYLDSLGLQTYLDQLGFQRIGFGCTTCIGNSGPLNNNIEEIIERDHLTVCSVLSGNRNFEGRVHPAVRLNWLASPPLVIAYALAGHTRIDLASEPLGKDKQGNAVFLRDIWPKDSLAREFAKQITKTQYEQSYQNLLVGDVSWEKLTLEKTVLYPWQEGSTYIRKPPFFDRREKPGTIQSARILAILGNSITTDHISPAGQINIGSPAADYLLAHRISPLQFNSYGARRGNHEVMVRGTFSNKRLQNSLAAPKEGGFTKIHGGDDRDGELLSIYDASQYYMERNTPLVVFAGKEYGTGSSRDWAAKGTYLLNIKAVIAESFERIHRNNLVGMGVLPLQLPQNTSVGDLALEGNETINIAWSEGLKAKQVVSLTIQRKTGEKTVLEVVVRIDNSRELEYFQAGGVLHYIADQFAHS